MRISVEIDNTLLSETMRAGGYNTKRAAVEEGLRLLVREKVYREILALRGTVHWEGDPHTARWAKRR